jgi:hypothetical protein
MSLSEFIPPDLSANTAVAICIIAFISATARADFPVSARH